MAKWMTLCKACSSRMDVLVENTTEQERAALDIAALLMSCRRCWSFYQGQLRFEKLEQAKALASRKG